MLFEVGLQVAFYKFKQLLNIYNHFEVDMLSLYVSTIISNRNQLLHFVIQLFLLQQLVTFIEDELRFIC